MKFTGAERHVEAAASPCSNLNHNLTNLLQHSFEVLHLSFVIFVQLHTSNANIWRLWLRGRASSVLLSGGCRFDPPGLHVEVSLGKILNPMNWTKASAKCKYSIFESTTFI